MLTDEWGGVSSASGCGQLCLNGLERLSLPRLEQGEIALAIDAAFRRRSSRGEAARASAHRVMVTAHSRCNSGEAAVQGCTPSTRQYSACCGDALDWRRAALKRQVALMYQH